MSPQDQTDLLTAIGLISDLRAEMQTGFRDTRDEIVKVQLRQATHLSWHETTDKKQEKQTISRRWVAGIAVSAAFSTVSVVIALAKLFVTP